MLLAVVATDEDDDVHSTRNANALTNALIERNR